MPSSILNLKFKGNKSFVAFSNLGDADSLTKTWKVCTKVAAYLEQGQRLENLSWRLWHLQNLIVDTDNAKSKREFRKLSKVMSDKLDKEKGRSIEELQAPGFQRNQSTEKIRQRAAEKERNREASKVAAAQGGLNRMQFTFALDMDPLTDGSTFQPAQHTQKPDFKPSAEFRDMSSTAKREHREREKERDKADRARAVLQRHAMEELREETTTPTPGMSAGMMVDSERDKPLTQRGRRASPAPTLSRQMGNGDQPFFTSAAQDHHAPAPTSIRFPSLFSNDFGPAALLFPSPSSNYRHTYGEGLEFSGSAGLSVVRPTIELPLDELLTGDEHSTPSSLSSYSHLPSIPEYRGPQAMDIDAQHQQHQHQHQNQNQTRPQHQTPEQQAAPRADQNNVGAYRLATKRETRSSSMSVSVPPSTRTIASGSMDPPTPTTATLASQASSASASASAPPKPALSIRTSSSTHPRPSPTAHYTTPSNASTSSNTSMPAPLPPASASASAPSTFAHNTAPGGQKAECVNCGATHTPLWRRGLNDELNCNACGLYCKLHKRPRPKTLRNTHGEGRSTTSVRNEPVDVMDGWAYPAQCYNCHTTTTPLWRKDDEGRTVCNACGLYYKLHGSSRPISMKSDVIRKRSRNDARRAGGSGEPTNEDSSSASPGPSTRPSPAQRSPTLAPDSSTTQLEYPEYEFSSWNNHGDLMALNGGDAGPFTVSGSFAASATLPGLGGGYPGPYHPDVITQAFSAELPFASEEMGSEHDREAENEDGEPRFTKRRRTSILSIASSASEPPSSATSYSSYDGGYVSLQSSVTSLTGSMMDFNANMSPFSMGASGVAASSGYLRDVGSFWHPPMKPMHDEHGSPFHPPMLTGAEEGPMDFLHPPMVPESAADDAFFHDYIHPPMLRMGEESPMQGYAQLHHGEDSHHGHGGDVMMFSSDGYEGFSRTFGGM